jgi:orotate phosphoribosyltransferase
MPYPEKRARLRALIEERSLKRGSFILRSGKTSNYFLDGKQTTLSAEGCALVGELIFDLIRDLDITAIGGPTLGADPIVAAVAAESWRQGRPMDAFIVRKETKDHGLGDRIAGPFREGQRVAIVEDVVTRAGAIGMAIDAAQEAGLEVVCAVTIVDRLEGGTEAMRQRGIEFRSLYTIRDFGLEPPAE